MRKVAIIIPTFNNHEYLRPCLHSILKNRSSANLFKIYVVNNGHENSCDFIEESQDVKILDAGKNLGWEGGINYGLKNTREELVVFMNDDTFIPETSMFWLNNLIEYFKHDKLGAMGGGSNTVMGLQNIFNEVDFPAFEAKFLIGFCVMVRRSALDDVGHLDETLPGGDDIDMSIRLRQGGYKLGIDRRVFIFHHGFKTGTRVRGNQTAANGWNSFKMFQNTNTALIKKHGLKVWFDTIKGSYEKPKPIDTFNDFDKEGQYILSELPKKGQILDLGCGSSKTRKDLIGVDMIAKGKTIDTLGSISVADVTSDVTDLPYELGEVDGIVARHILEHIIDPASTLTHWYGIMRDGAKIFIAVPNQDISNTIPMNIEHLHAFNPDSLKRLLNIVGFKNVKTHDPDNGISFIAVGTK